jgi:7-keto-8-aminopelargonate synthetase-like enzyme
VVAAYVKALEILEENPDLIPKLHRNVKQFRDGMTELGFEIMGNPESAIVPGNFYFFLISSFVERCQFSEGLCQ